MSTHTHLPRDFTIEHVRCVVPPETAQHTALVLVSGMFPTNSDVVDAPPLDMALNWFGTDLFPEPQERDDVPARQRAVFSARRAVSVLSGVTAPCVLDLVRVTHTRAIQGDVTRGTCRVCGFATLSLPGSSGTPALSLLPAYYTEDRICVAYMSLHAPHHVAPLSAVHDALYKALGQGTWLHGHRNYNAPPLPVMVDGRQGVRDSHLITVPTPGATYADDDDNVWSIAPRRAGEDLNYDTLAADLCGQSFHRVFQAVPRP